MNQYIQVYKKYFNLTLEFIRSGKGYFYIF